ncbi:TetR/AcrR family transcriptional regulator [Vibrio mediterranei]|uniref:TetR/AcrR family transcriptional regulator n=1 Tax=Vibrio mediterranei TaxID=689 RepID=UPI002283348F|nr:TetR/AcrR family transcriptional regulator [Vibrio mediterranei]MCY9855444.1 TetR/AcrR family transcriptional regulator [Vibrio mediterranei]
MSSVFGSDIVKRILVRAAINEIALVGIEGTNVRNVCLKANIGRTTFYKKFGGKEELLVAVRFYLNHRIKEELFDNWDDSDTFIDCWLKLAFSAWYLCVNYKNSVVAGEYIREYFHDLSSSVDIKELSPWLNRLAIEQAKGELISIDVKNLNVMTLGVVINLAKMNISQNDDCSIISDDMLKEIFIRIINSISKI